MMRLRHTLRSSLILTIAGIFLFCQGLFFLWLFFVEKAALEKRLREELAGTGTYLATLAKSQDAAILEEISEAFIKSGVLLSIKITNPERGISLYKAKEGGTGDKMSFPVAGESGNAGHVQVTYNRGAVDEAMRRFLIVALSFSSITFISLLLALLSFFRRKVSDTARYLFQAIDRVGRGDLTVQITIKGDDEMGEIAEGLSELVDRLRAILGRFSALSEYLAGTANQMRAALQPAGDLVQDQLKSAEGIILALHSADDLRSKIRMSTDALSGVSSENVSSLLEIRATAEEMAAGTGRLFWSAEDSQGMITEMSHMAQVIDDNASEVSYAVGTTLDSVDEISASLNTIREYAKTSAGLVSLLKKTMSDQGGSAIPDAIHAMEKLVEEVRLSVEIITRLEERSKWIEKILSVIKEVTEKTNLLSLNAAILAVQAGGEFGKSFAVVADEIKALSDRTSSSAREISQIVRMIQEEIKEAVTTINIGAGKVEQGKDMILSIGGAISGTLDTAHESTQMAQLIEKATDEQAEGLRHIRLSMEKIRQMISRMTNVTGEQKRGSYQILESFSEIKEASGLVKRGAEEHAKGTKLVSKNLERTSEMSKAIGQSAVDLEHVGRGIINSVDAMKDAWASTGHEIKEAIQKAATLLKEAENLSSEIYAFRTGHKKIRTRVAREGGKVFLDSPSQGDSVPVRFNRK
jgi:methyl-accepting chemotaxis protein